MICQENYQQKLCGPRGTGEADTEVSRLRRSSQPAQQAGDSPGGAVPPVPSTAQGSLTGFPGDTPRCGACLCATPGMLLTHAQLVIQILS